MTAPFRAVVIACAMTAGCGYWSAPLRSDVAPVTWGTPARRVDAPNGSDTLRSDGASRSVEARLSNLEHLRKEGIISSEEYRERRRSILADAFE